MHYGGNICKYISKNLLPAYKKNSYNSLIRRQMIHFQNGQKFCTGTSQKYVTKHMKICSTSLVKREVQIKIKMRLFTFINIVKFKKMLILNIG